MSGKCVKSATAKPTPITYCPLRIRSIGPFGRPKQGGRYRNERDHEKWGFDMKKLTLAAAAFVALTGSAIAADLPRKAPAAVAPAPLPVATWTGCYLTGGVGYGMWNQDNQLFDAGGALDAQHTDGGRGWLGRVGGGCDYQFWQKFVVGALADYDFASLKGNISSPFLGSQRRRENELGLGGWRPVRLPAVGYADGLRFRRLYPSPLQRYAFHPRFL